MTPKSISPRPSVAPRGTSRPSDIHAAPHPSRDTGGELFLDGQHYYRQIDDLCMNICVARKISDRHWSDFLEASLRLTAQIGCEGAVTIASFAHAHPSAVQRRITSEFLARNNVPTMARMGVISDNPLVRGAVTALGWTLPQATMRSFHSREFAACLEWLKENARFDLPVAIAAWGEGTAALRRRP